MAISILPPKINLPRISTQQYGPIWALIERDEDYDYYIVEGETVVGVAVFSPFTREFEEKMVGPRNWFLAL